MIQVIEFTKDHKLNYANSLANIVMSLSCT